MPENRSKTTTRRPAVYPLSTTEDQNSRLVSTNTLPGSKSKTNKHLSKVKNDHSKNKTKTRSNLNVSADTNPSTSSIKPPKSNDRSTSNDGKRSNLGTRSTIKTGSISTLEKSEGVWSDIDTLDDVKKMAQDYKGDGFPSNFESNLDQMRRSNAKLLTAMRDRNERLQKEYEARTENECATFVDDGENFFEAKKENEIEENNTRSHYTAMCGNKDAVINEQEAQYVEGVIDIIKKLRLPITPGTTEGESSDSLA
ncbi:uncharacterized protein NDAI_0E01560 [Naumovozyma dairenensis CBS 421]|uniref:Uncharacterized protein n=1 Tax=Naumovozyma dairenensis (strain ATCC 10597 / BCRC 20456 / CBS 421 / NBRC 0211 / NRRL Y-12639) TaxID=1071378 RepID=G0WB52_NAUDC|nr:hypothetical protein NDAI_0E01560 [Naumovozyma dairenensis CBS 421]CCD24972.1 hypothetical protein NDAI_0E01560 [Naumovozyma dairenensis CBS 421]